MNKTDQLNILNRITALRLGTEDGGHPVPAWYRLTSTGNLELRRRGRGDWVSVRYTITQEIHCQLAKAERYGIAEAVES